MRPAHAAATAVLLAMTGPAGPAGAQDDLRSGNLEPRRAAALRVASAPKEARVAALPALSDLLRSEKDGQVRLSVLEAVASLGPDAAPAIPALVHTLRTDYGGQRSEETHQDYRSALALAAVGKPAVGPLRELLAEKKENVRAEVAMALGRIGPDASPAVPDLVALLEDRSARVRNEAATALGRIGPAAVNPLSASSRHASASVRAAVLTALGGLTAPDEAIDTALIQGARDTEPTVRVAALRALGRRGGPDDALRPVLAENLEQKAPEVRAAAADVLSRRPTLVAALGPRLEALLRSTDPEVARLAAFLIGRRGVEAVPTLLDALRDPAAQVEPIAETLARVGRPVVPQLEMAAGDADHRMRRAALLALGRVRPLPPGSVATLARGLGDSEADVRAASLDSLGELAGRAAEAVPAVRDRLHDPSPAIRARAVAVLARLSGRDDGLVGVLSPSLDDPEPVVQRQAVETIRGLGPAGIKASRSILTKLESPHNEVRLAALRWVESQGTLAGEAVPALLKLLDDPAPEIRTAAVATLAALGKAAQPAFDRLAVLLREGDPATKQAAALTLASLELDPAVLRPHLGRALGDPSTDVQRAASRAIQKLGPARATFLPDVIEQAGRGEPQGVAWHAPPVRTPGPDPRTILELVALLRHDHPGVRALAARFLGLAGPAARDSIPALERLREDLSKEVRDQADASAPEAPRRGQGRTEGLTPLHRPRNLSPLLARGRPHGFHVSRGLASASRPTPHPRNLPRCEDSGAPSAGWCWSRPRPARASAGRRNRSTSRA
ncbi:MAG: HEAT repeat domain-containing protein [Isosphaeraceae bacterium]